MTSSRPAPARRNRNARELAYDTIRRKILSMELEPGARIDEVSLASELGASRTPVREALHQLHSEGLIQIMPRGGYQVSSMDIKKFHQVIDMQMLIARAATHRLVDFGTEEDFERLEEVIKRVDQAISDQDPASIAHYNGKLHALEAELTDNPFFTQFAETIYTHAERFAVLSFGSHQESRPHIDTHYGHVSHHHHDYLSALRARDLERALAIAEEHVILFRDRILQSVSGLSSLEVNVAPLPPISDSTSS